MWVKIKGELCNLNGVDFIIKGNENTCSGSPTMLELIYIKNKNKGVNFEFNSEKERDKEFDRLESKLIKIKDED